MKYKFLPINCGLKNYFKVYAIRLFCSLRKSNLKRPDYIHKNGQTTRVLSHLPHYKILSVYFHFIFYYVFMEKKVAFFSYLFYTP
jgi:hypothetical protein